jgi:uncharacterized protein YqgV (UPF0045/DUF77 family)
LRFQVFLRYSLSVVQKPYKGLMAMAREELPVKKLAAYSASLSSVAARVAKVVKELEAASIPWVPVHGKTVINHRLPELLKWCGKLELDAMEQKMVSEIGIDSQGSMEKRTYERRKEREAAKPKKKGAK